MAEDMIEQVAKAIDPVLMGLPDGDPITDFQKSENRKRARAAIEAMREPTRGMLMASGLFGRGTTAGKYRAMIQAALSGDPQ